MAGHVRIGTIKLIDESSRGGVIAPERIGAAKPDTDIYFKASDSKFRVGQLVQYVVENESQPLAAEVQILIDVPQSGR